MEQVANEKAGDEAGASVVAVVLAGGDPQDALARQAGVAVKALVPFAGKPLVCHVLQALQESGSVAALVYVGASPPSATEIALAVPAGETLAQSMAIGLETAQGLVAPGQRVLVVTADLPWLSPEAVDHFVRGSPLAGLVYPIISRKTAEAQFPGQARTYVKLREGQFTGGNIVLLEPQIIPKLLPFVDSVYRARKNPVLLASLLGVRTVFRLLTGRLSLAELEAHVSKLLDDEVRAFPTPYACLGADVDKPAHLTTSMSPAAGLR